MFTIRRNILFWSHFLNIEWRIDKGLSSLFLKIDINKLIQNLTWILPQLPFFRKRTFMQKLCWRPFFSYFFLPSCHSLLFLELQSQVCHISEKDQKYVKKRPRWWPSNGLVKALSIMAKKGAKITNQVLPLYFQIIFFFHLIKFENKPYCKIDAQKPIFLVLKTMVL